MLKELGIGSNRFYKHRKLLIDLRYLTVTKTRKDGKRDNNIYTLNQIVIEKQHLQNESTNNNSLLKTIVLKNNTLKKK